MYRVDYYTLAKCEDGTTGNIKQYSDTWYTDQMIDVIPNELQRVVNIRKGDGKYVPVITSINKIEGHLNR